MNAKHRRKGLGQRSAWLRILPLSHRTGRGTRMARESFPLLQNARLEGSSLRPTAVPPVLLVLRPSTSAEHPGGARTEQDYAPRAGSTDPGAALGTGGGGDARARLFRLGPAVASSAARPCTHFWKCFETVSPEGCCCLGAAQAIKPNGSSAGGALIPWLPLRWQCHTEGCAAAAGLCRLKLSCLTLPISCLFFGHF